MAIAAILLAGVAAFGALAYDAVSRSLVSSAELRLNTAATQLVQLNAVGTTTREQRHRELAADPALRAALLRPSAINVAAVRAALLRFGPLTPPLLDTELRDATGATLVTISGRPGHGTRIGTTGADTLGTGPYFVANDSVFGEYGAPVRDGGRVIGRVSQVRLATTGVTAGVQRLRDLIGADGATLLIGNADGSVWTDLTQRIERPVQVPGGIVRYERDGIARVSVLAQYANTPLALAIEFPESVLSAPARRLLWAFVTIGAFVVAVGTVLGWWMTAGVTGDIVRLTAAAEAIAQGKLTTPDVATERGDEIGRLGRAFGHMRNSVRQAHDSLESQVAARTEELHRAQEALVKKERLATLGQLSSSVGHELRNPLGVMTNAVYFLEMTLTEAPKKVIEYLGILRTQIRLSEKIVADLLDFARIRPPQRNRVAVEDLVQRQLERVTIPANIRIDQAGVDGATTVYVDQVQTGQILLNLLTNAIQAMEEGGGTLRLRSEHNASFVRLEVADSGPGIAPENLERVFEPLFTTKARGIGLGLSVSRSLAESNGGHLRVSSEPGRGTTFTLELPLGIA